MKLPNGYWLAHRHWVRQAIEEGRSSWEPASLDELGPELAAAVREEIASLAKAFGTERAPKLWREVGVEEDVEEEAKYGP